MTSKIRLSQDHQLMLCALEVLKLMADHMERSESVDADDVKWILGFCREVGNSCLDITEKSFLIPAMNGTSTESQRTHAGMNVATHHMVEDILEQLDKSSRAGDTPGFITLSRSYTNTLSDLIYDEDHYLPALIVPMMSDEKNRDRVAEYEQVEQQIQLLAAKYSPRLHKLEAKYVVPGNV
jgi:hemerythrin-like domain-containing protein